MGRNNLVVGLVGLVVVMVVVGLKFFAAVQGLIADLNRWAPHSESNFQSSLISDAHVEALRELDPIIIPTAHQSLCVDLALSFDLNRVSSTLFSSVENGDHFSGFHNKLT